MDMMNIENSQKIDPNIFNLFEYKPRKGDIKKMEIIKATIECLATDGLEKTTYEAIAKRIGTRRAHVAYYFSEKHDIFKSSIRFILATYQQISITHLQQAEDGTDMLYKYISAVFDWAKKHPHQLSVMLLLYYLCTVKEEYRTLNTEIRTNGEERLFYILAMKLEKNMAKNKARILSKNIQNMISAAIIDSVSTSRKSLDQAQAEVLELVQIMIES
jgi:AcrR family transcriptional regulator